MYASAHDFQITGGTFNHCAAGDLITIHNSGGKFRRILQRLCRHAVPQNSRQRFPPPGNYSSIPNPAQIAVVEWIAKEPNRNEEPAFVFWLYGAVGVGKTAFAQKISETWGTYLAANFYFSQKDPVRSHISHLIPTIAYQLAIHDELGLLFLPMLNTIISEKPHIFSSNLEEQYQELLYRPCARLLADRPFPRFPRLVLLDALDECRKASDIEKLLSLIRQSRNQIPPLPFKFLIFSRPEPHIRKAFRHPDFHSILESRDLGESISEKDIADYFRSEFEKIGQDDGPHHVGVDWPGEAIIQEFTSRACRQFAYAADVIQYVGDICGPPMERLETILRNKGSKSSFLELDLRYEKILSDARKEASEVVDTDNNNLVLDVLVHLSRHSKVFHKPRYDKSNVSNVADLFVLPKGEVWALLSCLHSILIVPESEDDVIKFRHTSFEEFLTNQKRSGVDSSVEACRERIAFYLVKRLVHTIQNDVRQKQYVPIL
ncbi:hypothetical protein EV361DRAFT_948193 [Lentinula raphanica]|nr:hypothetical protein EV361DRAFT_948193 [Lentinula raphanica]